MNCYFRESRLLAVGWRDSVGRPGFTHMHRRAPRSPKLRQAFGLPGRCSIARRAFSSLRELQDHVACFPPITTGRQETKLEPLSITVVTCT
jgi:hypothetical protein